MQQIYTELSNSTNPLCIRAAKVIKQLSTINDNNLQIIMNLQRQINESFYETGEQVSDVGSTGANDIGSDSSSEAGVSTENSSASVN